MATKRLTIRMLKFCNEYLANGGNGRGAAIVAGYSKKSANKTAVDLLSKSYIREYLKSRIDDILSSRDEDAVRLLQLIKHAAVFDVRRLLSFRPVKNEEGKTETEIVINNSDDLDPMDAQMITEIYQSPTGLRVKFVSKIQAWQMWGKFSRLFDDPDDESDDEATRIDSQERKNRIAELLAKRNKKS